MTPACLPLQDYAEPASRVLATKAQAGRAVAAIVDDPRRWVEVDFSGIAGITPEFATEFLRLANIARAETWLVPTHYDIPAGTLVIALKDRLQRLRDREWDRACERYCGG